MISLTPIEYATVVLCGMSTMVGVACGIIRWLHMCRPYDEDASYYYPARRALTICFLLNIFFLPVVISPGNEAVVFAARCAAPMLVCVAVNYSQFRYFSFSKYSRTITGHIFYILNLLWIILLATGSCIHSDIIMEYQQLCRTICIMLFCMSLTQYVASVWYFLRKIRLFHEDTYSNEEHFPLRTMRFTMALPGLYILMAVVTCCFKNGLLVFFPASMFIHVFLLVVYLHPHTDLTRIIKGEKDAPTGSNFKAYVEANIEELPETNLETLHNNILEILQKEELFKDPELELSAIVSRTCTSRTYISQALQQDGGFYQVVNQMRMQYADRYMVSNPAATAEEAALAAGFGSVRSYYRIKNK